MSMSTTKRKNVTASKLAARCARIPVTRLSAAAMKQAPMRYVQKRGHGMNAGTIEAMTSARVKCSAPNPARGAA
jgi:hypothetical protein